MAPLQDLLWWWFWWVADHLVCKHFFAFRSAGSHAVAALIDKLIEKDILTHSDARAFAVNAQAALINNSGPNIVEAARISSHRGIYQPQDNSFVSQ